MASISALLFLTILAVGFHAGIAIQCFECNSGSEHEGNACADPFDADAATKANLLKNCDALEQDVGAPEKRNYTLCRKFVQDVEGDYRIVRGCATKGRVGKCVDRTGTAKIKLQYCECQNDNPDKPCNVAFQTVASRSMLSIAAVFGSLLSAMLLH